jgi:hypothetical protein
MSTLQMVTITGADDSTDIQHMIALSREFPFVEWGILVSRSQEGGFRFPGQRWMKNLFLETVELNMKFSMHLCGRWVRELLKGSALIGELPYAYFACQRIQINTHAHPHELTSRGVDQLLGLDRDLIFQWDGVNDGLALEMLQHTSRVAALYDTSGGAGILPGNWPVMDERIACGYAGGLGPDNLIEQLSRIEVAAQGRPYWIDMERSVRSPDDSILDLDKVRAVLETACDWRLQPQEVTR